MTPSEDPALQALGPAVARTDLQSLPLIARGKVRDLYAVGDDRLLMVASDRLSAFDVVMKAPVPGKGRLLTQMALFWFDRLRHIVPNHLTGEDPLSVVSEAEREQVRGRAMLVRRLRPLPVEAVVRGYLAGSGWKEYQESGAVCGVALPAGLRNASRLPEPIFTPATKAAIGEHDENIPFAAVEQLLGAARAREVRDAALALYRHAAAHARARGIIVADTKFEFGLDARGALTLIDEVVTPDSSRFWPADTWQVGTSPPSFDKQYVRDYLETLDWDKRAPGPRLPAEVIARTSEKYREALARLTGPATVAAG
jgi:phosphoribosylaminoimidazole-succinocarboxamide synthase